MQETKRVVVTGLGLVTPLGCDLETVFARLLAGESGIDTITRFDHREHLVHIAGEVSGWEPERFLDKRQLRRLDLFAQFAVAAATMARDDAGLDVAAEPERVGAVVGSGVGGLATFEGEVRRLIDKGPARVNPLLIPMMIPNMGAAHISLTLGPKGPLSATCTACAAGSTAIGDAFEILRRGDAVAMFAGGSEAAIAPIGMAGFAAMRALSTRNDDPGPCVAAVRQGARRVRDGRGRGRARARRARARPRPRRPHLRRAGRLRYELRRLPHDGSRRDRPLQARAMQAAMRQAGVEPSEIDYINAHGTSTDVGDVAESRAIRHALGDAADSVAVSSTKSMIGHLLGGSGGVEAVVTVMTMVNGRIHPTANLTDPDPACDLDFVPATARKADIRIAASNSFGFGGHNVTLVFRRFEG